MVRNLLKDVHFFSNGSSAISGPGSNGYLCQATDRLRKLVDYINYAVTIVTVDF